MDPPFRCAREGVGGGTHEAEGGCPNFGSGSCFPTEQGTGWWLEQRGLSDATNAHDLTTACWEAC
eukprot:27912-Pyramimonas_sp.AAC.1